MVDEKVIPENLNATPQFIAALTQVVWTQMGMYPSANAYHPIVTGSGKWRLTPG